MSDDKKKSVRTAKAVTGVSWPVARSYYDPNRGHVMDVLEIKRTVNNKRGEPVEVTYYSHVRCLDEATIKQAEEARNALAKPLEL